MVNQETFLLLLEVHHGTSRPHVMPAVESRTEIEVVAPVSLQVQFLDVSTTAADVPAGSRVVFVESDVEWVTPERLGVLQDFSHRLLVWDSVEKKQSSVDAWCYRTRHAHDA